jgi:hypothetical protein
VYPDRGHACDACSAITESEATGYAWEAEDGTSSDDILHEPQFLDFLSLRGWLVKVT